MLSFRTSSRATCRLAAAAVTAGLAVTLAACGSSPPTTASTDADDIIGQECCVVLSSGVVDGIATAHDGWDIALVNWMIPHDALASEMAVLALTQADSQQVTEIAGVIDAVQGPRYQRMAAMATAWGQPVPSTDPAASPDLHDHGDAGEESGAPTLAPLSGAAFDQTFLTLMIAHHQDTLPTAQATVDNGTNEQAKQLAREILAVTTAEISAMQQMLATL